MAEDAIGFMRHLGHERFYLAGHSMGGGIAQVIAHRYPESVLGLSLCNTFRRIEPGSLAFLTNILKSLETGLDPILARQRLVANIFSPSTLQKAAGQAIAENHDLKRAAGISGFRRQLEALSYFDSRNWFNEIRVPTQIINSINDRPFFMTEAAIMSSNIKNAKSVLLPGGHASMIEQPRLVADAMMSFFIDVEERTETDATDVYCG
jgi:3-oxoadipate enol-lactonase